MTAVAPPTIKQRGSLLAGVLPVFQTPYHEDESIDYATLIREIDWLFEHGADGIAMAMVSEVLRLSHGERQTLAAAACRAADGRGPVVVSVGAESSHVAEELARHAESVGAAAVMAVPPIAAACPADELLRYYERLLSSVGCPVIVQDASGYLGRPLPVESLARLHRQFGDRILFKPEARPLGPQLSALLEATGGTARAFDGSGGVVLADSFARGAVGTMPGADLIRGIAALWQALQAGDGERVGRLAAPIAAIAGIPDSLDGFLAIEKHLLVRQGVFRNAIVRGPVAFTLDSTTRAEVDRLFDQMLKEVE